MALSKCRQVLHCTVGDRRTGQEDTLESEESKKSGCAQEFLSWQINACKEIGNGERVVSGECRWRVDRDRR